MILLYLGIIALIIGGYKKKRSWFYLASLLFTQGVILHQHELSTHELWIAHEYGKTILVEKKNENLVFHCQDTLDFSANIVKNYREIMAHKNIHFSSLKNAYDINGIALIIADGDWILDIEYPKKNLLLLKNNAKINLERLLIRHQPLRVIIDGSNSPYAIERWKRTLKKYAIPFHITSEKGALLLTPKSGSKVF